MEIGRLRYRDDYSELGVLPSGGWFESPPLHSAVGVMLLHSVSCYLSRRYATSVVSHGYATSAVGMLL